MQVQDQGMAGLISSEASPCGLQMAILLLSLHMVIPLSMTIIHGVSFCVQTFPSYKDISQIGLGTILTVSFKLNHLLKDHIFKYSHIHGNWG